MPDHNSERAKISSGTRWEDFVGYSRAVKAGNMVFVAGTTAVDEEGQIVGENDAYEQTRFILEKIKIALSKLNLKLEDIVRTRIYVVDISSWEEIGKAHGEFFRNIRPASTMVEVSALVDDKMLVEIEVDAVGS